MYYNYKLFFKYIMLNLNQFFFKYTIKNEKNTNLYILQKNFYFLTLHLKLSSLFYSTQLIDILAYELPLINNKVNKISTDNILNGINTSTVVYNFHSILTQQRFYIFLITKNFHNINKNNSNNTNNLTSITELFFNANWLEREVSELNGIFFFGKKDLRNLMLQYGDTSLPFLKHYPSIGLREIYYDTITDLLIQTPITIQY